MRLLQVAVAILLVLGLAVPALADHHESALKQEVEALGDALAEAMLADDIDTMLSFYAEDAISLPSFAPRMDGIAAFREQHAKDAAAGMKIHSFTATPTDVWQAGDQVIEIGKYEISLDVPGMGEVQDKGKYLTVWVRGEDGKLKVKVETWNTDMNPMAMMGGPEQEHEHGEEHGEGHGHGEGH